MLESGIVLSSTLVWHISGDENPMRLSYIKKNQQLYARTSWERALQFMWNVRIYTTLTETGMSGERKESELNNAEYAVEHSTAVRCHDVSFSRIYIYQLIGLVLGGAVSRQCGQSRARVVITYKCKQVARRSKYISECIYIYRPVRNIETITRTKNRCANLW